MADSSSSVETDVELELYEEIVGNLNYYTTPVTERSSRFNSNSEDKPPAPLSKNPLLQIPTRAQ